MSPAIRRTADRLVDSTLLTASARLVMVFGVPVTLGLASWLASTMIGLDKRVTTIESNRIEARSEITRRLEALEMQNREDLREARAVVSRLGAVEASQARSEAVQNATQRAVERIERLLDSQRRQ